MTTDAAADPSSPDANAILAALVAPEGRYLEPGCSPSAAAQDGAELFLVLRTESAWRMNGAALVKAALRRRLALCDSVLDNIEIVLHETLMNAVTHGNLGLSSACRGTLSGLDEFLEQVEAGLREAVASRRPVAVRALRLGGVLCLEVTDCGGGFVPPLPSIQEVPREQPYGRGLSLIRTLAARSEWRQETRTLAVWFCISPGEHLAP